MCSSDLHSLHKFGFNPSFTVADEPLRCESDFSSNDTGSLMQCKLNLVLLIFPAPFCYSCILFIFCPTQTRDQQHILCQAGVIQNLALLLSSTNPKVQMPAVKCLSALSFKNEEVAAIIVSTAHDVKSIPDLLIQLIARDKSHEMQLNVARCLTNVRKYFPKQAMVHCEFSRHFA